MPERENESKPDGYGEYLIYCQGYFFGFKVESLSDVNLAITNKVISGMTIETQETFLKGAEDGDCERVNNMAMTKNPILS
jgi:hypothetical protein